MTTPTPHTARLTLRLDPADKSQLVERAQHLGVPVSELVRRTLFPRSTSRGPTAREKARHHLTLLVQRLSSLIETAPPGDVRVPREDAEAILAIAHEILRSQLP